MKSYLLDTNAFAMALTDDPRLPEQTRQDMVTASRLALSVISLFELGQKVRLGKWPEMAPHIGRLGEQARQDGYDLIPLTARMAMDAALLDWSHRDPFDRIIATVARIEGLPLMSSDAAFDALSIPRNWH